MTNDVIPSLCEHNQGEFFGKTKCMRNGHLVWTECTKEHWGETPRCSFLEPDNSPEACERRLGWIKEEACK